MRNRRPGAPRSPWIAPSFLVLFAFFAVVAPARQRVTGELTANGQTGALRFASAFEVDSVLEPGYLDIRVVLSDRQLPELDLRSDERLAELTHDQGLVALVVLLNPDARVLSATPYHPAFTALITAGTWIEWQPSAYDESVAGRFRTDGTVRELNQEWSYDVTFSAPIVLDPEAETVDGG